MDASDDARSLIAAFTLPIYHQLVEFLGNSILLDKAGVDQKSLLNNVTFTEEFRDVTLFRKCSSLLKTCDVILDFSLGVRLLEKKGW